MHLSQLSIYPIKSSAPINLEVSNIVAEGLQYDRGFIVVDSNGAALTGREHPKLIRIQSIVEQTGLNIKVSGMDGVFIPFESKSKQISKFILFKKYPLKGIGISDEIDQWFSEYLGFECKLLTMDESTQRKMLEKETNNANDKVKYVDSSPIHLITDSSLVDLNSKLEKPVGHTNFRPNFVISGTKPYDEDDWHMIQIGECIFEVNKPCTRCVFTTLNQSTLKFNAQQEPLRTLNRYRRQESGSVDFGIYLIPRKYGRIKLGDQITVL